MSLWLIRANHKILGPYSYSEVLSKVKESEVTIYDEVAPSCGRWKVLGNSPEFEHEIRSLRDAGDIDANTETFALNTDTFTSTEQTYTGVTPGYIGEAEEPTVVPHSFEGARPIKNQGGPQPRSYGRPQARTQSSQSTESFNKILWSLAAIMVLLIGVGTFWEQILSMGGPGSELKIDRAIVDYQKGNYEEAFKQLKAVREKSPDAFDPSVLLIYAELGVSLEKDLLEQDKILDELMGVVADQGSLTNISILKSRIQTKYDKYAKAISILSERLKNAPDDSTKLQVSLANVYRLMNQPKSAAPYLKAAHESKFATSPEVALLKARLQLWVFEKTKNMEFLRSGQYTLKSMISTRYTFVREAATLLFLSGAMIQQNMNSWKQFVERANVYPISWPSLQRKELIMDMSQVYFSGLSSWCEVAEGLALKVPRHSLLVAGCFFNGGKEGAALSYLESALNRHPDNQNVRGAYAFVLSEVGNLDKAKATLSFLEKPESCVQCLHALSSICIKEPGYERCSLLESVDFRSHRDYGPTLWVRNGNMTRMETLELLDLYPDYKELLTLYTDGGWVK
jgi:tetratricopeptide (TPR) repeat protein